MKTILFCIILLFPIERSGVHFAFCILHLIKNTLVWMLADGKEIAQGVAVVDLLRPAGLFYFSMDSAKIACF